MKKRDVSATVAADMLAEIEALAESWDRSLTHTIGVLLRCGLHVAATEMVCRNCGCTSRNACKPCSWAAEDLCSQCDGEARS